MARPRWSYPCRGHRAPVGADEVNTTGADFWASAPPPPVPGAPRAPATAPVLPERLPTLTWDEVGSPDEHAVVAKRPRRRSGPRLARVVAGELLVTTAVLTVMYVAWLMWWTDVQADQAQADVVASLPWAGGTERPAGVRPVKHTAADAPDLPEPAESTTFAVLYVPRWGFDYERPISQGVGKTRVLDPLGIGHYPGTAMPGEIGNFAIAGHRVTYGKPFNGVADLIVGDPIIVQTDGSWYVYEVTSTEVVDPSDTTVLEPVPGEPGVAPTQATITLTTCHPMFSAAERFIVHGTLMYWWPAASGTPDELTGQAA